MMRSAYMMTAALLLCGCKAGPSGFQMPSADGGSGTQAPLPAAPPAPTITAPELTSLPTVALRGSSPGAAQIVVQTDHATTQVGIVLPDGTFCIDVPLQVGQINPLQVFAAGNGKASAPTVLKVVQAANLPAPANGTCTTSSGGSAPSCTDVNAACDPRCNGCPEDAYQPNFSPAQAPAIALRSSYAALQLCPCRADWFTFVLYKGQHITVEASYQKSADFDLDLGLFEGGDVLPQLSGKPSVVATTAGTSGDHATRTIDFTAPKGGAYYLQVSVAGGARGNGSYSLRTDSQ
jgi:hypothetical protein